MRLIVPFAPSAATATDGAMRRPASQDQGYRAPRETWVPLAAVVAAFLALVTLAAFPWTVSWRLTRVRLDMAEAIAPARQVVRDIASALALEVATRNRTGAPGAPELARQYSEAVAMERRCDSALGALSPRLGESLQGDIARLRSLTAQWHAERSLAMTGAGTAPKLTDVLATAARLDTALAARQAEHGARIRSLEALNIVLPSVLVPLLAVVLIAIYWTGRRMAALADEAEQGRFALAVASENKVTLLRGLTHDLKNALGAAGGFATLLREEISGPLTALQGQYVTRIGLIIEQTISAVEDALWVARTEAGALPMRRQQEDLRVLVLESASDYGAAAERAGLTLTVELTEDLPSIDTDRSHVSKIIGNLLSNAIKYTPTGGRVWLRASARPGRDGHAIGRWVVIEVCDTGPGIPAALREQVFDEFFRAPTATTTARGEGIGLAMSRRVARLLGGEITLDSEEGRGCAFTLWLPAPSRDAASLDSSPAPGSSPPTTAETRVAGEAVGATPKGRRASARSRLGGPGSYDRRRAVQ